MPVSLHELMGDAAEADVTIGRGTLHISYRPQAITPEMLRLVMVADKPLPPGATEADVNERVNAAVDCLVPEDGEPVLTGWDLYESVNPETGEPTGPMIPITRERLSRMGLGVLWGVVRGMMEAAQMGEGSGTPTAPRLPGSSARGISHSSRKSGSKASR